MHLKRRSLHRAHQQPPTCPAATSQPPTPPAVLRASRLPPAAPASDPKKAMASLTGHSCCESEIAPPAEERGRSAYLLSTAIVAPGGDCRQLRMRPPANAPPDCMICRRLTQRAQRLTDRLSVCLNRNRQLTEFAFQLHWHPLEIAGFSARSSKVVELPTQRRPPSPV